jgi:hypothetical protein
MAVSEAKLEANRRSSQKSCGPVTEAGKRRAKLNAVKHGVRAATLVLLDEDPQALEDRRADWAASLMPRGAAEQRIVDDAVEYSWLRDRARRAQEARIATNIVNVGVDETDGFRRLSDDRIPNQHPDSRDLERAPQLRKEAVRGAPRRARDRKAQAHGCRGRAPGPLRHH